VNLKGKKCLVTAGPTYEAIDPVRYIGNRSSGKMGIEIASELFNRGAEVHLILGPSSQSIPDSIYTARVESSDQMYDAVMSIISKMDIGIFSAAVADYKPKYRAEEKIKKADTNFSIELVKTKDILKEVGTTKTKNQLIVGFALETNNEVEHAKAKIENKNLDFIVLNSLKNEGAGFQYDTNQISILDRQNNITNFELKSKKEVAIDIVDYIEKMY
jgi:phosphopantothenoylcysteine decarboxylase / phosphopantothenate---cysteine ligase